MSLARYRPATRTAIDAGITSQDDWEIFSGGAMESPPAAATHWRFRLQPESPPGGRTTSVSTVGARSIRGKAWLLNALHWLSSRRPFPIRAGPTRALISTPARSHSHTPECNDFRFFRAYSRGTRRGRGMAAAAGPAGGFPEHSMLLKSFVLCSRIDPPKIVVCVSPGQIIGCGCERGLS